MATEEDRIEERKELARMLVSLRYDISNPALNIRNSLDEPVEQITLADFYNGPTATWLRMNTDWDWKFLAYNDLDEVQTVRDFGKICFAHLTLKPTPFPLIEEIAL
jgi:hypothetical protein